MLRSEVRANRQKWIDFLKKPGRKSAIESLDRGRGRRCCLGHGCYVMGLKPVRVGDDIFYDHESQYAPSSFMSWVGLWNSKGAPKSYEITFDINRIPYYSLALANDSGVCPQDIGRYLESVIEGGVNTPFKPLSDYPES
jgi:hypothetical protein